jgi:meso-butanediol dehydrogenase/(S,S)-butanediol dehydrogenase/diacetyl reductase
MEGIEGGVAVVTGGSSGIGLATANLLLSHGARVVIVARGAERLALVSAELAADHNEDHVATIALDVAAPGAAAHILETTQERFGPVTLLCNSAAIDGEAKPATELSTAHFRTVLEVNVLATFKLARAVARAAIERKASASIVNVSSINGLLAEEHFTDYNTSKGAVVSLTQSLALDLAPHGIRVNAVCPGYTLTSMTADYLRDPAVRAHIEAGIPMRRIADPDEIAQVITFLLSARASYVSGVALPVDGARTAGFTGAATQP